jgi:hypothetical protein
MLVACGVSVHPSHQVIRRRTLPIIATDSTSRHPIILFRIAPRRVREPARNHEAMLVKLAPECGERLRRRVRAARSFRRATTRSRSTCRGLAEVWLELDPGAYIIICWMDSHAETIPCASSESRTCGRTTRRRPHDVVVKLIDFRVSRRELHRIVSRALETVGPRCTSRCAAVRRREDTADLSSGTRPGGLTARARGQGI